MIWQKGSWLAGVILIVTLPLRFGLRYALRGSAALATSGSSTDLLFTYLAIFLTLLVGRAVTMLGRHPLVVQEILA